MNDSRNISHDYPDAQEEIPYKEELAYFCIAPSHLLLDTRLSDAEKILFMIVNGLTRQRGYCWASDKYLAEKTGVTPQEIKKRLKVLEELGYITRETKRKDNGLNWDRKIFSNYNHEDAIRRPREVHTAPSEALYGAQNNNNINNIREKEEGAQSAPARERAPTPMPAAPLPKAKERATHVATTDEEHAKLIAKHGEGKTQAFYEHLSEWKEATPKSKWKKGDYRSILRWVVDAYEEQKKRKSKIEAVEVEEINKKGAIHAAATLKEKAKQMSCTIDALHDRLEICPIGYSQREPFAIKYTENGFKEQLHGACRKWGLIT